MPSNKVFQEIDHNVSQYANNQKAIAHLEDAGRLLNSAHHVLGWGSVSPEVRATINDLKSSVGDTLRDLTGETQRHAMAFMRQIEESISLTHEDEFRIVIDEVQQDHSNVIFTMEDEVLKVMIPIEDEELFMDCLLSYVAVINSKLVDHGMNHIILYDRDTNEPRFTIWKNSNESFAKIPVDYR